MSVPRDSMPLGHGVPRLKPPVTVAKAMTGTIVSQDAPDAWQDTPCIPDQISDPDLWRSVDVRAHVFDLGNGDDLTVYNKMLADVHSPSTNKIVLEQRTEAFQTLGSWKVLILVQTVKFRKIIVKPETKSEPDHDTV